MIDFCFPLALIKKCCQHDLAEFFWRHSSRGWLGSADEFPLPNHLIWRDCEFPVPADSLANRRNGNTYHTLIDIESEYRGVAKFAHEQNGRLYLSDLAFSRFRLVGQINLTSNGFNDSSPCF